MLALIHQFRKIDNDFIIVDLLKLSWTDTQYFGLISSIGPPEGSFAATASVYEQAKDENYIKDIFVFKH